MTVPSATTNNPARMNGKETRYMTVNDVVCCVGVI